MHICKMDDTCPGYLVIRYTEKYRTLVSNSGGGVVKRVWLCCCVYLGMVLLEDGEESTACLVPMVFSVLTWQVVGSVDES